MTPRSRRPMPHQRLNLADVFEEARLRMTAPGVRHAPHCRGHTWLGEHALVGPLEPILYGEGNPSGAGIDDSFFRFSSLGADVAVTLLDRLPELYLATERQNDGPTIGSVLRAVAANPEHLRAHGYVIGPGRCDERITVEGVLFRADAEYRLCPIYGPPLDNCDCERLYGRLRFELGVHDAFVRPHELDRWLGYDWNDGQYRPERWYRAWWD